MIKLLNPTLKREKVSDKVWLIPQKELSRFFKITTLLMSMSEFSVEVKVLYKRIKLLINRSGINFSFLYLKEVTRLTVRFLAGSPEVDFSNQGVYVGRDPKGLPKIIPAKLRQVLIKRDFTADGALGRLFKPHQRPVQFVLTLLTVFRVFKSVQKISLGSITRPFEGISRTLDVK
jgi:hypothetical protein